MNNLEKFRSVTNAVVAHVGVLRYLNGHEWAFQSTRTNPDPSTQLVLLSQTLHRGRRLIVILES